MLLSDMCLLLFCIERRHLDLQHYRDASKVLFTMQAGTLNT